MRSEANFTGAVKNGFSKIALSPLAERANTSLHNYP